MIIICNTLVLGFQSQVFLYERRNKLDPSFIKSLMKVNIVSMSLCLSKFHQFFKSWAFKSHPHTTILSACLKNKNFFSMSIHSNVMTLNNSLRIEKKSYHFLSIKKLYVYWKECLEGGEIQDKLNDCWHSPLR